MKIFKFFIIILIVFFLCPLIADAGGLSYGQKRQLQDYGYSYSDIMRMDRQIQDQETYKYRGSSGERYQYDLSQPGDRIRYQVDPGAQLRDQINMPIKPGVEIDRNLFQFGGGVKP